MLGHFGRKPAVIMIVGVNGGGKTTSLGTSQHALLYSWFSVAFSVDFAAGRNGIGSSNLALWSCCVNKLLPLEWFECHEELFIMLV